MDSGLSWLLAGLAAALVVAVVATCAVLVVSVRGRRRLEGELAASRAELAAVQKRLDGLSGRVAPPVPALPEAQEFVITTAGLPDVPPEASGPELPHRPLTGREFASVALGESLVTIVALGHGVRRALSPENRNRIAFEMRREVRRARKQRRSDLKEAKRRLRAQAFVTDAARAEDAA